MIQDSETVSLLAFFTLPVVIFVLGLWFKHNPPKEINKLKGYRTRRSMSSQVAWDFAQIYSAGLMIKAALPTLIVAAAGSSFMKYAGGISKEVYIAVVLIGQTLFLFPIYFMTEAKLKKIVPEEDKEEK